LPVSSKTVLWLFHVKPEFKLDMFHVEHTLTVVATRAALAL